MALKPRICKFFNVSAIYQRFFPTSPKESLTPEAAVSKVFL
jgi:hypothetical protein